MIHGPTRARTGACMLFVLVLAAGCIPERLGPLPDTKPKPDTAVVDVTPDRSVPADVVDTLELAVEDVPVDETALPDLPPDIADTQTEELPDPCGDGVCEGEDCKGCPEDCGLCDSDCGNGICEEAGFDPEENVNNCAVVVNPLPSRKYRTGAFSSDSMT